MWELICHVQVEAVLIVSPYVDNIMLHADPFHSYCVAIVVAAQAAVEDWARKHGINFVDFQELCQKEETMKEVYASLVKVFLIHAKLLSFFLFSVIISKDVFS